MREGLVVCSSPPLPSSSSPPSSRRRYDRPYPYLSWYQSLPISRLVLRNYRRISANTASIWRTPVPFCGGRGKEGEELEDRTGRGSRTTCPLCWPAALKTSSNEAEDWYRDVGFLEGGERGGEEGKRRTQRRRDVFTKQFGTKSPLWRRVSCAHKRMDNGGRSVKRARQNGETNCTKKLAIRRVLLRVIY